MEGGPYQEYFYIEIPSEGVQKLRRFVYVHEVNSPRFPMQFGVEVSLTNTTFGEIILTFGCVVGGGNNGTT